jgi:hypothetical protein
LSALWPGAPILAAPAPQALAVAGYCLFGVGGGGALTATFSPPVGKLSGSLVGINGQGTCTSNVSSDTVSLNLSFNTGPWTCAAGVGIGGGATSWSDNNPPQQIALAADTVGVGPIMIVAIQSPSLRFQATAVLAWSPAAVAACVTTGVSTVPLTGVMTYVSA